MLFLFELDTDQALQNCAIPNYAAGSQVCWGATALCTAGELHCTCTPYCSTGIPAFAYQPLGFGPPDTIAIAIGGTTYKAANPQSSRVYEIGAGHFDAGSAADIIGFTGDSSKDVGVGSVYFNAQSSTCNGKVARFTASVPLSCTYDSGNNATCTAPVPLPLTFLGFS